MKSLCPLTGSVPHGECLWGLSVSLRETLGPRWPAGWRGEMEWPAGESAQRVGIGEMVGWTGACRRCHPGIGLSHTVCRWNLLDTGTTGGGGTRLHSDSAGACCRTPELWRAEKNRWTCIASLLRQSLPIRKHCPGEKCSSIKLIIRFLGVWLSMMGAGETLSFFLKKHRDDSPAVILQ